MLEHKYTKDNELPVDLIARENLTHEQLAMAKLLVQVGDKNGSYYDNLKRFKDILLAPKINKQELREICFKDDLKKELHLVEGNFDEKRERKIAARRNLKARMKKLKKKYSDKAADMDAEVDEYGNKKKTIDTKSMGDLSSSELEITNSDNTSSESSFDSEASRINFWRDINTGDEEYANAVIVSQNQSGMAETENIFQQI